MRGKERLALARAGECNRRGVAGVAIAQIGTTTNKLRGDNVMATPLNILNKSKVQLGFIGLGLMGSGLTRRLHSAGWNVHAWNRSPGPADVLRRAGIAIAASVAELVIYADVVLSSLANDEAVYSVYFANDGVFSAAKRGTIILEMSTISPDLSRLLHQQASTHGISFLDLAVSGSTPAVEAGTITLLGGGDPKIFEQCTPIYESIAKQWFLIGPGSSGVLMKL